MTDKVGTITWSYIAGQLRVQLNQMQMQLQQLYVDLGHLFVYGNAISDANCTQEEMLGSNSGEVFGKMSIFNALVRNERMIRNGNNPAMAEQAFQNYLSGTKEPWIDDFLRPHIRSINLTEASKHQEMASLNTRIKIVEKRLEDAEKRADIA